MTFLRTIIFSALFSAPLLMFPADEPADKPVKEETPVETVQKAEKIEVKGTLLERGTRAPVSRKVFYIIEKDNKKIRTDKEGGFSFSLAEGTYTLSFPIVGYEKFETKIEVKKGEKLELTIRLEPLVINPYKIVVTGEKNKGEVSVQRITIEEASKIPGTNRDVLKAVTSLPGVTNISVFNGIGSGLVVRGSSAGDSSTVVNEHGIPLMYHFGGLDPVIEPELVESLDFFAGGFSSEYFNTMGGVIQINLRDPRKDRWGGYVNLSLLNVSFMVEGPVSKKDYLAVAFKRGMLDAYVKIVEELGFFNNSVSFSTYPFYYDAMILYVHEFNKRNRLKMYTVGSWDEVRLGFDNQTSIQKMSNTAKTKTQFVQHTTEWHFRENDFKSLFSPMAEVVWVDINAGDAAYFKNFFFQLELSEKMEVKLNDIHKLRFGAKFYYGFYTMDVNLFAMPKEGEVAYNPLSNEIEDHSEGHYWFPGFYFMDEITYNGLTVVPGINFIYDEHNTQMMFDPRLTIKYKINDQWLLKTSGGLYSQLPSNDESYEPWGTPGLRPEKALHAIVGVEYNPLDFLEFDLQGYYKHFFDLVRRDDSFDLSSFSNGGIGYAYGVEFLIRHKMTEKFFGWISYSFCMSERKDSPDSDWRPFDVDVNHNLIAVASYKLNKYWQFGARFKLASGAPYSNLMFTDYSFDADNNFNIPQYRGDVNDSRLPITHQLDLRIDKYWLFDNWIFSTYLDIQNVYMAKNVLGVSYRNDYTEKVYTYGFPIMVFLGFKGDF